MVKRIDKCKKRKIVKEKAKNEVDKREDMRACCDKFSDTEDWRNKENGGEEKVINTQASQFNSLKI